MNRRSLQKQSGSKLHIVSTGISDQVFEYNPRFSPDHFRIGSAPDLPTLIADSFFLVKRNTFFVKINGDRVRQVNDLFGICNNDSTFSEK